MQSSEINKMIYAAKATEKAHKVMQSALEYVPHELLVKSDETSFAATSFLAGLAIEFGIKEGVSNSDLQVVVEATLSMIMGEEIARWYASNLNNMLKQDDSRLAINAGRSASLISADDKDGVGTLLLALLKQADSK